jgi:hypothetical protein
VTGSAGTKARAKATRAEATGRRVGAEFGLGAYLGAHDGSPSEQRDIVLFCVVTFLFISPLIWGIGWLLMDPPDGRWIGGAVVIVISLAFLAAATMGLARDRRLWLYQYEGGLAQVAGQRRRVSWPEVRGVETRAHGHRVTISTDRRRGRRAALPGQPNGFVARQVLEHAARRAGTSFSAG